MKKTEVYEYTEQEVLTYLRRERKDFAKYSDEKVLDHATDYDFTPVFRANDDKEYYWSEKKIEI